MGGDSKQGPLSYEIGSWLDYGYYVPIHARDNTLHTLYMGPFRTHESALQSARHNKSKFMYRCFMKPVQRVVPENPEPY